MTLRSFQQTAFLFCDVKASRECAWHQEKKVGRKGQGKKDGKMLTSSCLTEVRILEWLPFPTPGDLPNPGIKPMFLASPALAGRFFTTAPPGKPLN